MTIIVSMHLGSDRFHFETKKEGFEEDFKKERLLEGFPKTNEKKFPDQLTHRIYDGLFGLVKDEWIVVVKCLPFPYHNACAEIAVQISIDNGNICAKDNKGEFSAFSEDPLFIAEVINLAVTSRVTNFLMKKQKKIRVAI